MITFSLSTLLFMLHLHLVLFLLVKKKQLSNADLRNDPHFSASKIFLSYFLMFGSQLYGLYYYNFNNQAISEIFIIGFLISIFGYILRFWSMNTLNQFFTMEIGIRENHRIIDHGPYKYIRHPGYTGYLLMLGGMSIAYESLAVFIFSFIQLVIFLYNRIQVEEEMLLNEFGDNYRDYQLRTNYLVPFVI